MEVCRLLFGLGSKDALEFEGVLSNLIVLKVQEEPQIPVLVIVCDELRYR